MLSKILKEHLPIDVTRMRSAEFTRSQLALEKAKLERIEKGAGWKEVKACPLCGETASEEVLVKYGSPLHQCARCELWYHLRIAADAGDVYNDDAYEIFAAEEIPGLFEYKRDRFGRERVALLEKVCGGLAGRKVLEVGCGNGYFLAAAKEAGARCFGSERSVKNQRKARENTGLPVHTESLSSFPERGFDVVAAFDLIEHVEKPALLMEEVSGLLRPGGHVLLYTTNHDSFSVRALREHSSYIDVAEHVVLFNDASLERLGRTAGFTAVYRATRGLDIRNVLAHLHYLGEPPNRFLADHADELQAMVDHSGCGDSIRMIFRKDGGPG